MATIDGRIFNTDIRWGNYCQAHGIKDVFREQQDKFAQRVSKHIDKYGHEYTIIRDQTEEEAAWEKDWAKRRDNYLVLRDTFRLWDFHKWMAWSQFKWYLEHSSADISIYMPCDCVDRQCDMACAYFGTECPRIKEEIKIPEILSVSEIEN